jgi:hypothetical protein
MTMTMIYFSTENIQPTTSASTDVGHWKEEASSVVSTSSMMSIIFTAVKDPMSTLNKTAVQPAASEMTMTIISFSTENIGHIKEVTSSVTPSLSVMTTSKYSMHSTSIQPSFSTSPGNKPAGMF